MIMDALKSLPNRNELLPLLSVSRFMNQLAVPILYQTIALEDPIMPGMEPEPAAYANPDQPERLCIALRNPRYAQYTTTIIEQRWEYHLLPSFLTAHSSTLRYLYVDEGPVESAEELLPSSLPNLHTFQGSPWFWEAIMKVAPIKHLSTVKDDTYTTTDTITSELFENLITFMIPLSQFATVCPLLRNIVAVNLSINEEDTEIDDQSLMNIPSKRLRYIGFSRRGRFNDFDRVVASLFDHYPSLVVVEFSEPGNRMGYMVSRYYRDSDYQKPDQFQRRDPWRLEAWFEPMGQDFQRFCAALLPVPVGVPLASSQSSHLCSDSLLYLTVIMKNPNRPASSCGVLPLELWKMVVDELRCFPNRNELLPLLSVSRFMHQLVVPIFYQTIALDDVVMTGMDPEPAAYADPDDPERLCVGLRNTRNAQYTTTIIEQRWEYLRNMIFVSEIFSYLKNLQRLYLFSSADTNLSPIFDAIPASAPLTHLCVPSLYGRSILPSFLAAHSATLRFIRVEANLMDRGLELFPSALPNVHTFEGSPWVWEAIMRVAPIKHLATVNDMSFTMPDTLPDNLFCNLTSFMGLLSQITKVSPLLRSIAALHLSIDEGSTIEIELLINLPSDRLRYIGFSCSSRLDDFEPVVAVLFNRYPSLVFIEYSELEDDIGYTVSRYYPNYDHQKPERFRRREPWRLESWFGPMGEDFERFCAIIEFTKGDMYADCQVYRYDRLNEHPPKRFRRRELGLFEAWFERVGNDFETLYGSE
ncbi:hypothetical protein ONZ45_g10504 [Pleurotus djamor]|nr:hypothetical protein ONZ45_g10504 [Pleurotus djamor]